jgi:enoyl-CoA hydratase/carnithine racemase
MTFQAPKSFLFHIESGVGVITLNRPDKLNALTFEIYQELGDFFVQLNRMPEVRSLVITGSGKGFCSGGDKKDIIAELFSRDMNGLLQFTRTTGALIQNMRQVKKPLIAAINGVAVGAGAVMAIACDMRIASANAKIGFIFPQVGLCGADMGATYLLPKIIGTGLASELLFTGDLIDSQRALQIHLFNQVVDQPFDTAFALAKKLADGPAFAHSMTKQMIESEAQMTLAQAIEAEAQAQAICMQHPDFKEAYDAWAEKRTPRFEGANHQ